MNVEGTYPIFELVVFTSRFSDLFDVHLYDIPFLVVVRYVTISSEQVRPWQLAEVVEYLLSCGDVLQSDHSHRIFILKEVCL